MGEYLEILDLYGLDLEATDRPRYTPELMDRIMEDSCVD